MAKEWHHYKADQIEVRWSSVRCIHAAYCIRNLPEVFDTRKRPWVQPANAATDEVAEVIHLCPTGALQYTRHDGGPSEPTPKNQIIVTDDGPLYIRGNLTLIGPDGEVQLTGETRLALCRCGASSHRPFCDNSHRKIGFKADPAGTRIESDATFQPRGDLQITVRSGGPLVLKGPFEIWDEDGSLLFQGEKKTLCRCGASQNKPYCDSTHNDIGFEG